MSWPRAVAVAVVAVVAAATAGCGAGNTGSARGLAAPGTPSAADDFNATPPGSTPAGWSVAGGGRAVVEAVPDPVDRSLAVSRPAKARATHATRRFPGASGTVEVQLRARFEDAGAGYDVLRLADTRGTVAAGLAVERGRFRDTASGREFGTADARRWYFVRAVLRVDDHRWDLYLDGRSVLTDAPFAPAAAKAAELGQVSVGVRGGPAGTLRVDTVAARRVPDPSVDYVVFDQFDDDPGRTVPTDHVVTASGGAVAVTPTPSETDRSLLLRNPPGGGEARAVRPFAPQRGTVVVQANVRTDEVDGTKLALYVEKSGNGGIATSIQFSDGWLVHFDGVTGHRLARVTPGEWYTLKLVLDLTARRFEAYVDGRRAAPPSDGPGVRVEPRWPMREPAPAEIDQLTFGVGSGQSGTVRVDNVMVFKNPVAEPPGPVRDVRAAPYRAAGDGVTDDTAAIQRAIDDVPAGGSVVLAGGVFKAGTLRLRSDLTLWVARDAVLLGSPDDTAYPVLQKNPAGTPIAGGLLTRGFLVSAGADRLRIEGGGTIDGNGRKPEWGIEGGVHRPALMALTQGRDVIVRNLHIRNAATWAVVPDEIDGLLLADLTIDSDIYANRDGIDVTDSHSVLVERVAVSSDDDAICFKSYSSKGVDGVVVRLSTVGRSSRANGVKFGTGSTTAFRNVVVEDMLIKHVDKAAVKVTAVDGGVAGNLAFRRITVDTALRGVFVLLGRRSGVGPAPVWVSGLEFSEIVGDRLAEPSALSGQTVGGATYRLYGVLLSGVRLVVAGGVPRVPPAATEYAGDYPESNHWTGAETLPANGFWFRHVTALTVHDSAVTTSTPDARPAMDFPDTADVVTG